MKNQRTVADWLAESQKFLMEHGRTLLGLEPYVEAIIRAPDVFGGVQLRTEVGDLIHLGGLSLQMSKEKCAELGLNRLDRLLRHPLKDLPIQAQNLFLDIVYDYPRWTVELGLQALVRQRVWRTVGKFEPEPEHVRAHRFWRDFVEASPAERFPILEGAVSGRQDALLRWEHSSGHLHVQKDGRRYSYSLPEGWEEALPLTGFKVWPLAHNVKLDLKLLPREESADTAGISIESDIPATIANTIAGLPLSKVVSHPWLDRFDLTIVSCVTGNGKTHLLFVGAMDLRRTTLFYRDPSLDALAAKFFAELEPARTVLLDRLSNRHLGADWWSTHAEIPEVQRLHGRNHRRRQAHTVHHAKPQIV